MRSSTKKPRNDPEEHSPDGGYIIKTYHPSMEEMKDFSAFIKRIHEDNGHRAGLAKIIPPPEYKPRKIGYSDDTLYNLEIKNPIRQVVQGESGLFQQLNVVQSKKTKVKDFKKLAESEHTTPEYSNFDELERQFWRRIRYQPPIYGADVSGTLYDKDVDEFNLTKLNTILDHIKQDYSVSIEGVNTAYLYFGMWKTSFCWHTEDMDLYSINYLHDGEPKFWYSISPEHGKRFERLAASFFPHNSRTCRAFLRHKTTLISPAVLRKYSIPFSKCVQKKGEFMITFPYSYHSGFNCGFNIAEATNFALEYWIEFGKWATRCECSSESVQISMQTFVKRYQSDRYENWLRGKDIGPDPREPRHRSAAPKPSEYDLYLTGAHERNQEEEENKSYLRQIEASNIKIKTKAARKAYPSLEETYHRYKEYLQMKDPSRFDLPMQSSYPPLANQLEPMDQIPNNQQLAHYGQFNVNNQNINYNQEHVEKMLYNHQNQKDTSKELIKQESKKRKREEKVRALKEKKMKDPVIPSKELLQFLPLTFTHEKRFNRCIAALYPHCSICQLLEAHPKDNEDIWGPIAPKVSDAAPAVNDIQTAEQETPMNVSPCTPKSEAVGSSTPISPVTPVIAGPQVEEFKLPATSPILLSRGLFDRHEKGLSNRAGTSSTIKQEVPMDESLEGDSGCAVDSAFLDLDMESCSLLQCSVCMLCVHKTCYGVEKLPAVRSDWVCDRCEQKNRSLVFCELCPCRGGALKEINRKWVHITCALTTQDYKFIDLIRPTKDAKPVQNSEKDTSKTKIQEPVDENPCIYCKSHVSLAKYVQGKCISCIGYFTDTPDACHVPCEKTYHPTCGHRNGVRFDAIERDTEPSLDEPLKSICQDCLKMSLSSPGDDLNIVSNEETAVKPALEVLPTGARVIAKYKDRLYDGEISSYANVAYFEVFFPKYSEFEVEIEATTRVRHYDTTKTYSVGDEVNVELTKNHFRKGKFKRKQEREEYTVKFDDASLAELGPVKIDRRDIFVNIDQVPEELIESYSGETNKDYVTTENDQPPHEQNGGGSSETSLSVNPASGGDHEW